MDERVIRAITPSGTVPSTIDGQNQMAQGVEKGAGLAGKQRVDRHEAGRLVKVVSDEIDAAGDREPALAAPRRT